MKTATANENRVSAATWVGLFVALFGILIVRWAVALFYPALSFAGVIWKEVFIWLCVTGLFVVIRRGEGLLLSSINLRFDRIFSSLLWGFLLFVMCAVVGALVATLTHFRGGELGQALVRFPLWLSFLVVLRAGIVEELFYRGYAIERLQRLGLNRWWAGFLPLLVFGVAHVTNGWANVLLALALGLVLMLVYLWRRDLLANMIGHFLVDFSSIVLPRLFMHH